MKTCVPIVIPLKRRVSFLVQDRKHIFKELIGVSAKPSTSGPEFFFLLY